MATEMNKVQELLFGADGLSVSNFKLFPGSDREVTSEQIAGEINRVFGEIMRAEPAF
ncbi:hypothetical protein [Xanthomonas campestris]|uniref:hypothetical protein n=1 Tax=Xanthomonas campestris TaxID=339 RepID=UPI0015F25861|nr:hypothetical protein [Xanthomonas campestris]